MAQRQMSTLLKNNALKVCFANAPKYSTASQRTRMAEKNITFDPSTTAQRAKEAAVFAREQYTGDIKLHSPNHAPTTIKPTFEEKLPEEIDPLGAASTTGIDIQKQENLAESTYWQDKKQQIRKRGSAEKARSKLENL